MRVQRMITAAILVALPVWWAAAGPSVAPVGALPQGTTLPEAERRPVLTGAQGWMLHVPDFDAPAEARCVDPCTSAPPSKVAWPGWAPIGRSMTIAHAGTIHRWSYRSQAFSAKFGDTMPGQEHDGGVEPLWSVAATEAQPTPEPAGPTAPEGTPSKPDEIGASPEEKPHEPFLNGYQPWALGLELGNYPVRVGRNPDDPNPQSEEVGGFSLGFYLEAYPFRNLGFGYHGFSAFTDGPTVPTSYGEYVTSNLHFSASLLTVQWVVFGSDHPVRWVIIGGYGRGSVSGLSTHEVGTPVSHSGPVLLGGTFVNFGGEILHFRLGMNRVDSHIHADDLAGTDGSSTYVYAAISVQTLLYFRFHP